MRLYDDYADYTRKYKKIYGERTLVLMEVGSFWELYDCDEGRGANMVEVCGILNITLSRKNKNVLEVSIANPLMAGFPSHALSKFLPMLIESDYTVVLVGQVTPPPAPKRDVIGVYSKGTYIDGSHHVNDVAMGNFIMCLSCDTSTNFLTRRRSTIIGVAIVDLGTGVVRVGEFAEEEEVYKIYSEVRPTELIIYKTSDDFDKTVLNKVLGVAPPASVRDKTCVGKDDYISRSEHQTFLFKKSYSSHTGLLTVHEALGVERLLYGSCALAALLRYVMDHDSALMRNLQLPVILEKGEYMDLYYNCADQLELKALIRKLNKCVTPMGRRYFQWRLLNPFGCKERVSNELNETELYYTLGVSKLEELRKVLGGVCDLERMFRRASLGKLHPHELVAVEASLRALLGLGYQNGEDINRVCENIHNEFDLNVCSAFGIETLGARAFKIGVCEEFDGLVARVDGLEKRWLDLCDAWNEKAGGAFFKLERNERDGWFIAVTTKRWEATRKLLVGAGDFHLTGTTNSHNKLVSTDMRADWTELCNVNVRLEAIVRSRYQRFLESFTDRYSDVMKAAWEWVAHKDFYVCAGWIAWNYDYVKPQVVDCDVEAKGSWLTGKAMRHPLVELLDSCVGSYVPNDVDLKDNGAWLLYGLNAAGKSTLMKMVGLNVIMAQAGLYVPCDEMQLACYKSLFTRISKGDDLMNGMSTFMVEMSELRNILGRADSRSLVIGDELCAGTETLSAIGIVAAGVRELLDKGSSFIFATHLHELVDLVDTKRIRICHLHVEYDAVRMGLRYERVLRDGDGPRTYGIEVCKALGLPDAFVFEALKVRQALERGGVAESSARSSRYNSRLVYEDMCEICGKTCVGNSEVHHIKEQASWLPGKYQKERKNHLNNLVVLCETCHDRIHLEKSEVKKVLTSNGVQSFVVASGTKHIESDTKIDTNAIQAIKYMRNIEKLPYTKIIERVYADFGVKMSKYKITQIAKK